MVEVGVVEVRVRGRRWKGESMENSSWMLSPSAGWKGTHLSHWYSESSMLYVCDAGKQSVLLTVRFYLPHRS
jgi:hypothetical protein